MSEEQPPTTPDASGASAASDGRSPTGPAKPKKKHHYVRNSLIGLLVVVLVIVGGLYLVYRHLDGNITGINVNSHLGHHRPKEYQVAGPSQPMNVLILGDDTRQGANGHGIGGTTPGLSDTAILLHLSANRKFAYGVSLPRDAMVQRPPCDLKGGGVDPGGLTQFNDAFAIGGPACTIKTVEKLTHVRIDHFVVVDFVGFRKMVDALGGVTVCLPYAVDDTSNHSDIHFKAGVQTLSGMQALKYVREREAMGNGMDIGRMKRQQAFIASMIHKVMSVGILTDPIRLYDFLDAATKSLTTDSRFAHLSDLVSLGLSLRHIGLGNIKFITVPWKLWPQDPNRVIWRKSADKLWPVFIHDRPLPSRYFGQAITAASGGVGTPGTTATHKHLTPQQRKIARQNKQMAVQNGLCTS